MYTIYNARVDTVTKKPNISVQVNLFHNGAMILEGTPQASTFEVQSDWSRINDYGYMRLNKESEPGDYALQVIIKDLSPDSKGKTASQWIDYEVE
jgi:hypothetical protein